MTAVPRNALEIDGFKHVYPDGIVLSVSLWRKQLTRVLDGGPCWLVQMVHTADGGYKDHHVNRYSGRNVKPMLDDFLNAKLIANTPTGQKEGESCRT